eukprot:gene12719-6916_t
MARRLKKKFELSDSYKPDFNKNYNIKLKVNENRNIIQTNPKNNIKFLKMRLKDIYLWERIEKK